MVVRSHPHGPGSAWQMAEGRLPGEASPVRHHGGNTSRRDYLTRAGESSAGWTATTAGGTLRHVAQPARDVQGPPSSLCGRLHHHEHVADSAAIWSQTSRGTLLDRQLREQDGRGHDLAFESTNQRLDDV